MITDTRNAGSGPMQGPVTPRADASFNRSASAGTWVPPYRATPQLQAGGASPKGLAVKYQRGPVGFLQWLAATHPDLYAHVRTTRPDLIAQAGALQTAMAQGAALSGLGDLTDTITSWIGQIGNVANTALQTYAQYKTLTQKPPIQQQLNQAAAGQQPLAYPGTPITPPSAAAVARPGGGLGFGTTGALMVGGGLLLAGGLYWMTRRPRRRAA